MFISLSLITMSVFFSLFLFRVFFFPFSISLLSAQSVISHFLIHSTVLLSVCLFFLSVLQHCSVQVDQLFAIVYTHYLSNKKYSSGNNYTIPVTLTHA